jgi:predicted cation transporter
MKKIILLLLVLLSGSVGAAIASQVLLTIDINGTVKVTTKEVTLYAAEAFSPFLSPIGEQVSTITVGDVEEGETIPLGAFYLVYTGNTELGVTYNTLDTLNDLPLYVEIEAS